VKYRLRRNFKDSFKLTYDVVTGFSKDRIIQAQAELIRQQERMKELLNQKMLEIEYFKGQCMYHLIIFLY
jgi:hypothetical protein